MKLLVLGGTVFLSRAVAEEAVRRGHDVTVACRGTSGSLPDGVRHLPLDRETQSLADVLPSVPDAEAVAAARPPFDAVVDIARQPQRVRDAVRALPDAHWVFVSTINVYADESVPGGTPETLALREPILEDSAEDSAESYGAKKVGCEQIVTAGAASSVVIRPGLIIGPGDPSGRFTYWPNRLADGGEVLAPGSPDEQVQVIDVRDLALWIVDAAERRLTGVFDGCGPQLPRSEFLDQVAAGVVAGVDRAADVDLGPAGVPGRAGGRAVERTAVGAGLAAAAGVRRTLRPRRLRESRRGADHPSAGGVRTRHAGLAAGDAGCRCHRADPRRGV